MKTLNRMKTVFAAIALISAVAFSDHALGQPSMSVLPVNTSTVSSQVLSEADWQELSLQLQDHIVTQLAGLGTISKLSREHILLLMKEVPAPDPENLTAEAYKLISKKENLHYFLKLSIESFQVIDTLAIVPIRVIIVDGNNGKKFWEKIVKINKVVNPPLTRLLLLNEILKPRLNEIMKEAKTLKY
jgi:hypothetical protein